MTKHKAPAKIGISPKLVALAAKIDSEYARADHLEAEAPDEDVDYSKIWRLEDKLAETVATNLEEFKLKARYVDGVDQWDSPGDPVAKSIVRDLLALDRKPKAADPKEAGQTA